MGSYSLPPPSGCLIGPSSGLGFRSVALFDCLRFTGTCSAFFVAAAMSLYVVREDVPSRFD
jgi:hypothetical protein